MKSAGKLRQLQAQFGKDIPWAALKIVRAKPKRRKKIKKVFDPFTREWKPAA